MDGSALRQVTQLVWLHALVSQCQSRPISTVLCLAMTYLTSGWSGWWSGIFTSPPPLGCRLESSRGYYVDWGFSHYLAVWVFSKTETSFLVFSPFSRVIKLAFLSFLRKAIRAYWSKRRVETNCAFQNHPNSFRDITCTWCYRKPFHIIFPPCKVSNRTF